MPAFRPQNDAERGQCLDAVAHLDGLTGLDEAIAQVFASTFAPARARYQEASLAYALAKATWTRLRREAAAADRLHDRTFRLWVGTVRSEEGMEIPHELASVLGVLPGHFVALSYRDEVTKARYLFEQLSKRPDLAGDPLRLAAFRAAHEALAIKVAAGEKAKSAKIKARKTRVAAARVFDRTWGLLVRTLHEVEGPDQALCELPVFHRSDKSVPSDEDEDAEALELAEGEEIEEQPDQPHPARTVAVTHPPESI